MSSIVWGVCGIGNGHTFRQLPLIEYFARTHRIVLFVYGESLAFYARHFRLHPNVTLEEVAVPYYIGDAFGLDFYKAADLQVNAQSDFFRMNCLAMARTQEAIGRPDLVISDYEPVSAQFAYAHRSPLITIDQQSKYLAGQFPTLLHGQTYEDEVARLMMFFPRAEARLACSFFQVPRAPRGVEVMFCPPVLRETVIGMKGRRQSDRVSILLYLTSQKAFGQSSEHIADLCAAHSDVDFHVFAKEEVRHTDQVSRSVRFYRHGDERFDEILASCWGVVSTAGHTLLSEAMYLGKPVYAMPLPLYEQEMNAHVIDEYGFGCSYPSLDEKMLASFIERLPDYARAIQRDNTVLLQTPGQEQICAKIASFLS